MSRKNPAPPPSHAKGLFATFLVLGGLAAAAWFLYDPWLKPYVEKFTGGTSSNDSSHVIKNPSDVPPPPVAKPKTESAGPSTPAPATPAPPAPKSELELLLEAKYPMPEIPPLTAIVDEWRNVPPKAYPAEVTAKEAVAFQLVVNGQAVGSSNVAPGTPLKPVRLVGGRLFVASPADPSMSAEIAVDQTDFKERIEARYRQFVETKRQEVETKRARARQILAADPAKLDLLVGKAAPSVGNDDGGDPRVAPVKASLKAGEVASATFEEARSFHWNGSETIRGEYAGTYDTVTVRFEIDTIFGRFPVEYKALLRGGRVHAWIDPVTEDRI